MMLNLTNKQWGRFRIGDIFKISTGANIPSKELKEGVIPRITAKDTNNGIDQFTIRLDTRSYRTNQKCVSISFLGSCFYQDKESSFDMKIHSITPKDNIDFNRYIGLFVVNQCRMQFVKFSYGNQLSSADLPRQYITLPITDAGNPDWEYMEEYMMLKEKQILKPTIEKLCKHLIDNELQGGGRALHSNWKAFCFTEVFTEIQRGKRLKKADHKIGTTPYVSSTSFNNGVDGFIGNDSGVRKFHDCISLANSGSVGSAFYHQYEFVASDHITQLKRDGLDKYAYLFMIPIINRLSEKYGFNREINDERIKRERLLLPVTEDGDIDFQFMSSFMKQIETDILGTTLNVFKNRLLDNRLNINKLGGVIWKTFDFADIFIIKKGFYNKKPPCFEKGTIPFIGASDSNNGFTGFTTYSVIEKSSKVGYGKNEPIEQKIYDGNAICVTNNGSVGYAYYQQHPFTCTHDVNPLYLKNRKLNRHLAMFLISCIEKQRVCFTYARKWRPKRMVKSRLMLPVNADGRPDWDFMEQYMRNVESNELLKIIKYIA